MLHKFDKDLPEFTSKRKDWMALLARAPQNLLENRIGQYEVSHSIKWLRRPETGLMMVQGRVGGSGERFNFGEITVTRCALRIGDIEENSPLGISYVMGRNHRQAQLAAMADALLQNFSLHADLESNLLKPIRQILQEKYLQTQKETQTTKVDFFTVAREANANKSEDAS